MDNFRDRGVVIVGVSGSGLTAASEAIAAMRTAGDTSQTVVIVDDFPESSFARESMKELGTRIQDLAMVPISYNDPKSGQELRRERRKKNRKNKKR